MTDSVVVDLMRQAFVTALLVGGPIFIAVLLIGIGVSVLQAITQVQEATLTFLPKMFGAGVILVLSGHFMLDRLVHFALNLFSTLPAYAR